jgi:hypothetical protein
MSNIPGRVFFKDDELFTDWFPREGDGIIMRAEAIDGNTTGLSLVMEPYTKNAKETGKGGLVDASGSWDLTVVGSTANRGKIQENIKLSTGTLGMKELVRFRIYLTGGSSASDWISVRLFPPVFFEASS